jgi:hypothetical protein
VDYDPLLTIKINKCEDPASILITVKADKAVPWKKTFKSDQSGQMPVEVLGLSYTAFFLFGSDEVYLDVSLKTTNSNLQLEVIIMG